MDGLWTRNFESDADRHAPILAKQSGTAAALYLWLHSRAFSCGNDIRISIGDLASILNSNDTTVRRAVKSLVANGLITYEGRRGTGGGSRFSLLDLSDSKSGKNAQLNSAKLPHSEVVNSASSLDSIWQIRSIT